MSKKALGNPRTSSGDHKVTTLADVRADLRLDIATAAGPRDWKDTRERWLGRAADRLRWPISRIKSLWYDDRSNPSAVEYITLRARADALRAANAAAMEQADANKSEIARLLSRVATGVVPQCPGYGAHPVVDIVDRVGEADRPVV